MDAGGGGGGGAARNSGAGDTVLQRTSRAGAQRELTAGESAACGAAAGLVARAVVSPLDVVKITLQLETGRRGGGGVAACAARILRTEGARGFFKGNLAAEYLYLTYGAAQFVAFRGVEALLRRVPGVPRAAQSFVGGAAAGAIATAATYPLDLLRTRFAAQDLARRVHPSIAAAVRRIYADEGARGFYRGLWPACLQIMPYMGIVFGSYDALAAAYAWLRRRGPLRADSRLARALDASQDAVLGAAAAVVGKTCVYPLDLVRKRLQIQGPLLPRYARGAVPAYSGVGDALVRIVRSEGPRALFRGLTPALVKAAPTSATIFFVFGQTRDLVLALRP
ncbi:mitochondrial thiamine pyrophosphate transporter [Coemansia javaensis]|uniref:Mitochondrial thiamine pyrophosphate transporter n=1 Tax=Coemansia javaensis TaxID=2761396 RepID=A0A9W8LH73_9FUNG|nr:mitochondrial thiamine pyrophosphate transporter [Coemansia javaensis]